ncbi:hypothetical protein GCM10010124_02080 [Pilimelia terevasa]|uniref:Uncharacterized protein n=1 Tax=Pilimelia terevasa TaxID=53372 RepID=A0A8J3BIA8_9ACTN|nr:hypothetical protein [Pilimelia terevasa]GGK13120.1 hypothetical protein GCM10010124_02080 [Pilimelia terevasa]
MHRRSWLDPLETAVVGGKPVYVARIAVCQCCMLIHANGECCDSDDHGGDGCEPLNLLEGQDIALGGEHEPGCPNGPDGPRDTDCACEIDNHSTSSCDGCGSTLHGERHAMTVFEPMSDAQATPVAPSGVEQ